MALAPPRGMKDTRAYQWPMPVALCRLVFGHALGLTKYQTYSGFLRIGRAAIFGKQPSDRTPHISPHGIEPAQYGCLTSGKNHAHPRRITILTQQISRLPWIEFGLHAR